MTINSKLKEVFAQHNIEYSEGILYLFAAYYNIPLNDKMLEALRKAIGQINATHIIDRDYAQGTLIWNIPLFAEHQDLKWDWVDLEYRAMFRKIRPDRAGTLASCTKRMKEFFKDNPAVRKDDVMEAVKLYMSEVNSDYLQGADYFIKKGVGASATSKLTEYLERIALRKEVEKERNLRLMGEE